MSPRRDYLRRLEQYLSDAAKNQFSERYARYLAGCVLREAVSDAGELKRVATLERLGAQLVPSRSQSYLYRLMRIAEAMPLFLADQGRPPRNPRQIAFEEFENGGCNQLGIRKLETFLSSGLDNTPAAGTPQPRRRGRPRRQHNAPESASAAKHPAGATEELNDLELGILRLSTEMEEAIRRGIRYAAIFTGDLLRFQAICHSKGVKNRAELIRELPIDRFACPNAELHVWGYSFQTKLIDELINCWGFQRVGHLTLKSPELTGFEHGPWRSATSICVNAIRGKGAFKASSQSDFIDVGFGDDWSSAKLTLHLQLVSGCGLIELLTTSSTATWRGFDK